VCVDSEDNVILVGRTYSSDGISTDGAFQTELLGDVDMQIEKYTTDCVRLWGTYWGGSKTDHIRGVIADKYDNLYFGSHTDSPDGIAAGDPDNGNYIFRDQFAGGDGDDGVLGYFTKDGFRKWATYFGGTGTEVVRRLKFDVDGNIILVGYSESDSGITTSGVYQPDWHGNSDLILIKWDTTGHRIWGTYLGGENEDHGRSVATDDEDNIYVNGSTGSKFGIKKNAFKDSSAGGQDYLLAKFTKDGNCKWSTYWGGEVEDRGRGVYVDKDGEFVYFTGYSASADGVTLPGAFQPDWSEGYDNTGEPFHDAVLMKWSTNGYPIWSTFIGGPKDDRGRAITMIGHEVYIAGTTSNATVMSTPNGFQPVFGGNDDMFIEHFDPNGNRVWGSYIGEEGSESTLALAVDKSHTHIYQVGTTSSIDIATPGVAQVVYGGYEDAYLVKIQVDTVTGLTTPANETALNIYPDPNNGSFSMKYHLTEQGTLSIYNIKGAMIYSKPLNVADEKIAVTDINAVPGIYTCRITVNGKELASRNFIVIK
ncbi:MAG: T9SS type A sorting domain-containing protein, partial [Chitinophagales bacterium]